MFGLHPFGIHDERPQRIRQPPRAAPAQPAAPRISLDEEPDAYRITVRAPDSLALRDPHATLDGSHVVIEGEIVNTQADTSSYQYITRSRIGVYSYPDHCRRPFGVLAPNTRICGGAPSRGGWILLDDEESWVLDDGSLALVRRPAPTRPIPFAKRVALPADADVRRATTEPLGKHGMLVCIPRFVRRSSEVPRHIPVNVRSSPPPPTKPAARSAATSKPAAASAAHARAAKVSADEPTHTQQQHKRQHAADSRGEREPLRRSSLLDDGVGPVLTEVSASSRNVQSPVEQSPVEEWLATSKGGFVRSPDGSPLGERMRRESREAAAEDGKRRAARVELPGHGKGFEPVEPAAAVAEPVAHQVEDEWVAVERAEAMEADEGGDLAYWGF